MGIFSVNHCRQEPFSAGIYTLPYLDVSNVDIMYQVRGPCHSDLINGLAKPNPLVNYSVNVLVSGTRTIPEALRDHLNLTGQNAWSTSKHWSRRESQSSNSEFHCCIPSWVLDPHRMLHKYISVYISVDMMEVTSAMKLHRGSIIRCHLFKYMYLGR